MPKKTQAYDTTSSKNLLVSSSLGFRDLNESEPEAENPRALAEFLR
jgi:hypothetical protein